MKTELQKDLNDLVNTLRFYGEDGKITEMKWELVHVTFKEFICSETFNTYNTERRKLVFDLYENLTLILDDIEEFRIKYPNGIPEGKLAVL